MTPFRRTCKEVTALVIAREDRALPWRDRLALRLHMAICAACPTFERQVFTMRNAMKQWRNYEGAEALARSADDQSPPKP
ncbi:zf-HC2 domain-containing protein [Rhodoferax sp. UBA5149]|uniref:zf-HC2 domain-containing protein n=1 Tax=Rhodoferax sp. UBA5149 TaxID=1947379 RepID=UPI00260034C7|nr:zf-HC2 domain-containing protein [Rhodoferax sp. UBA5149]